MIGKLWSKLDDAERRLRRSFGMDIESKSGRRWAKLHYHVFDHAFLRSFWTNFDEIGPGIYRSNQPTTGRFETYAEMGVKTIINLRGEDKYSYYLFEKETCDRLGMKLIDIKMWARMATKKARILEAIEAIRTSEKPLIFHCKSGADRTGLMGAVYKLVFEDATVDEARKQLGLRYIHLKQTATGIQDYILDVYEARLNLNQIGFEDWIRREYVGKQLQKGFDEKIKPAQLAKQLMTDAA